ncbi:MAG: protoporphyrinogen oxidase [Haloarculaceae archaeon]
MSVGIVGGGVSGLALHHHLRERGVASVVFEADDEPGGVIRSTRTDGRVLERGPQRTRLTPVVEDLVEAVGLKKELRTANEDGPLYVYRDGDLRVAPRSPREAVTTSLFSLSGKLRALAEPLTGPPRDGETVRSYFRRSFGREVADNYLAPLYAGLYASDPAAMPVEHSAAKALTKTGPTDSVLVNVVHGALYGTAPPPVVSFDAGLQRLPEALAECHAESVRLSTPVCDLRDEDNGDGGAFVFETAAGETERFDRVVVTTPAGAASGLLSSIAPDAADRLDRLTFNPMAVVHLLADSDGGFDADSDTSDASRGTPTGAGFQVPHDEPLHTLGTTWNASLLDRDGVYTAYLGGAKNPALLDWPDDRIETTAADEFEAVTGLPVDPLSVARLVPGMPAYDTSWAALEGLETPDGVHLCTNYVARAGIPGRVRAARDLAERLAAETTTADAGTGRNRPSVASGTAG